jgi:hypothetical protein
VIDELVALSVGTSSQVSRARLVAMVSAITTELAWATAAPQTVSVVVRRMVTVCFCFFFPFVLLLFLNCSGSDERMIGGGFKLLRKADCASRRRCGVIEGVVPGDRQEPNGSD